MEERNERRAEFKDPSSQVKLEEKAIFLWELENGDGKTSEPAAGKCGGYAAMNCFHFDLLDLLVGVNLVTFILPKLSKNYTYTLYSSSLCLGNLNFSQILDNTFRLL